MRRTIGASKARKTMNAAEELGFDRKPVTFAQVRKMALSLGQVEEGTSYGTPGFRVNGVLFARLREDQDTLVVRMDQDRRSEVIAADPETYFVTDHYKDYPWILTKLSRIRPDALADLLRSAWRAAKELRGRRGKKHKQRKA